VQTLEAGNRVLGAENPDTLLSMSTTATELGGYLLADNNPYQFMKGCKKGRIQPPILAMLLAVLPNKLLIVKG